MARLPQTDNTVNPGMWASGNLRKWNRPYKITINGKFLQGGSYFTCFPYFFRSFQYSPCFIGWMEWAVRLENGCRQLSGTACLVYNDVAGVSWNRTLSFRHVDNPTGTRMHRERVASLSASPYWVDWSILINTLGVLHKIWISFVQYQSIYSWRNK